MKIAKETAERIKNVMETSDYEICLERKKAYILGEIAIILAGLLDAKFAERSQDATD